MGKIRFLRGVSTGAALYTGESGEPVYETDTGIIRVCNGSTPGGTRFVSEDGTQTLTNKTFIAAKIDDGGTGVQQIRDKYGYTALRFVSQNNAVNYLQFNNGATGFGPVLAAGGSDTHIDVRLKAQGGAGKCYAGPSGAPMAINDRQTSNPSVGINNTSPVVGGQQLWRSDLLEWFYYDDARAKWLSMAVIPYLFGHSGNDLAPDIRLRTIGQASDTDSVYRIPYPTTIVGYSYARVDSDLSGFSTMVNAATLKFTVATSATRGSDVSSTINYDLAADDDLWVKIAGTAENSMSPRTFILYTRRKST